MAMARVSGERPIEIIVASRHDPIPSLTRNGLDARHSRDRVFLDDMAEFPEMNAVRQPGQCICSKIAR
jgi:hypothetical protein